MKEHQLSDEAELDLLYDRAIDLEESIDNLTRQITCAMSAHAEGMSLRSDIVSDIHDLHRAKETLVFDLGQVSAHVQELEQRIELRNMKALEEQRQAETYAALENHLDWLDVEIKSSQDGPENDQWPEPDRDRR